MEKSDYLDHIILEILNQLSHTKNGLRYVDLKTKLNISERGDRIDLDKEKNKWVVKITKNLIGGKHKLGKII